MQFDRVRRSPDDDVRPIPEDDARYVSARAEPHFAPRIGHLLLLGSSWRSRCRRARSAPRRSCDCQPCQSWQHARGRRADQCRPSSATQILASERPATVPRREPMPTSRKAGSRMFARCSGERSHAEKIERAEASGPVPQAMFSPMRVQE